MFRRPSSDPCSRSVHFRCPFLLVLSISCVTRKPKLSRIGTFGFIRAVPSISTKRTQVPPSPFPFLLVSFKFSGFLSSSTLQFHQSLASHGPRADFRALLHGMSTLHREKSAMEWRVCCECMQVHVSDHLRNEISVCIFFLQKNQRRLWLHGTQKQPLI